MPLWLLPTALLAVGGGAGANARYWLGAWVRGLQGDSPFPWATFAVNVSGSVILGAVAAACLHHPDESRRNWYLLLGTGFSTFSLETAELLRTGRPATAAAYVLGSVAAGVFGLWLAMRLADRTG